MTKKNTPAIVQSNPQTSLTPENVHQHQWHVIHKTYASPRRDSVAISTLQGDSLNYALFGLTTIFLECVLCKDLRKTLMLGSDIAQLDELVDKTELYGPQYFQRNGVTYVLNKYIPAPSAVQVRY